jgi:hypothetical protein
MLIDTGTDKRVLNPGVTRFFPYLPLLAGVIILFAPLVFGGRVLFWGLPVLQFVPWWVEALNQLQQGIIPLWNSNSGMGAPLIANYQLGFFYPPNWLYILNGLIFGVEGIAWTQGLIAGFHVLLSGIGMVKLSRVMGAKLPGQIIAGLSYALSGYLVSRAWFLSENAAVTWIPWILFATLLLVKEIVRILTEDSGWSNVFVSKPFLTFVFFLTLQLLAGHAQLAWYNLVFVVTWFFFWLINLRKINENNYRFLLIGFITLGIAIVFSVLLAAIQLIPTAEYLMNSQRSSQIDPELALTYSFWPWRLLGLIAPNFFGNPAAGNYWGYASYWEDAIYIGVIPLLGVLSIIFRPVSPEQKKLNLYLCLVMVISFILALGKNTPIFPFLFNHVPTFDMFQAPTRWTILIIVSLSILAGSGFENFSRPTGRKLYWTRLGIAGAIAIVFGAGAGWFALSNQNDTTRLQTMSSSLAILGIILSGGGILYLLLPTREQRKNIHTVWWIFFFVWITIDLCFAGFGLNPAGELEIYRFPSRLSEQNISGRVYMPPDVENGLKFDHYFKFETFHSVDDWTALQNTYLPNISLIENISSINNFDPLIPARYAVWMDTLANAAPETASVLLNLSDVSVVVNKDVNNPGGVTLIPAPQNDYVRWYSCSNSLLDKNGVLNELFEYPEKFLDQVYLESEAGDYSHDWQQQCYPATFAELTWLVNNANRKIFQVDSSQNGWIMLSEIWYPGWTVFVDNKRTENLRSNYLFQGVFVPSGLHEVEFRYQPISFRLGIYVSTFSLILLISLLIKNKRNPRN